jgi:hypothetical protein
LRDILLNTRLNSAILRNAIVSVFWWIVFYPGFYSGDSFAVLEMAKTGDLNGLWSAPWALAVQILSLHGTYPGVVTLTMALLLSLSMTLFFYSFLPSKNASVITCLLQATPLVGAMGITLWHDIPLTSGLLLVVTFLIRSNHLGSFTLNESLKLLLPGMVLITFKGNGLPTVLLLFAFVILINIKKPGKRFLVLGVLMSILLTFFSTTFMADSKNHDLELGTGWIVSDISCYASTERGEGFVERNIPGIGTTQTWSSPSACNWFSDAKLTSGEVALARSRLPSAFYKLLLENPKFVLVTHLKRHEYLIPLPIFGIPNPPFIHSTIEFSNSGVEWAFPAVAEKARFIVRAWNYGNFFFAYSGLWLAVIALVWFKSRRKDHLYVLTVSIILSASIFIVAGISDARYMHFVLICGQGILMNYLYKTLQTFWKAKCPSLRNQNLK